MIKHKLVDFVIQVRSHLCHCIILMHTYAAVHVRHRQGDQRNEASRQRPRPHRRNRVPLRRTLSDLILHLSHLSLVSCSLTNLRLYIPPRTLPHILELYAMKALMLIRLRGRLLRRPRLHSRCCRRLLHPRPRPLRLDWRFSCPCLCRAGVG